MPVRPDQRPREFLAVYLVQGGDNGVAGGVHGLTVEVGTGLPGDEDGGLPHEGEDVLETLLHPCPLVTGYSPNENLDTTVKPTGGITPEI